MGSFATPAQMASKSKGAIPADTPFLQEELNAASKAIRNECGWHVALEEEQVFTLNGFNGKFIYLPTQRIKSLDAVSIDGIALDLATDQLQWSPDGQLWRPSWAYNFRSIEVTVTHGLEAVPADIVDMTLLVAARSLGSPLGAVREQTLSSSVTWSQTGFNQAGGVSLLDSEKDALAEYKVGYVP
jgi:hypothetical protein